jgi:hypothetical protein
LIFISAVKHKFEQNGLPIFIATNSSCFIKQSSPPNPAIARLSATARLLGLSISTSSGKMTTMSNLDRVRSELQGIRSIAVRHGIDNYFAISDGASITANNNSPVIRKLRDDLIAWELQNNGDPDEDWGS